jgi:uncharacterized protein (TIGR03000 family)
VAEFLQRRLSLPRVGKKRPIYRLVLVTVLLLGPVNAQTTERTQPATVKVTVPADARVYFNDRLTQQTGETRVFITPPLEIRNNKKYTYTVRAVVKDPGGEDETIVKTVEVLPGRTTEIVLRPFTQEELKRIAEAQIRAGILSYTTPKISPEGKELFYSPGTVMLPDHAATPLAILLQTQLRIELIRQKMFQQPENRAFIERYCREAETVVAKQVSTIKKGGKDDEELIQALQELEEEVTDIVQKGMNKWAKSQGFTSAKSQIKTSAQSFDVIVIASAGSKVRYIPELLKMIAELHGSEPRWADCAIGESTMLTQGIYIFQLTKDNKTTPFRRSIRKNGPIQLE